ncbi:Nn.00g085640.m01.CDS01 [Neocucurbitaria sp. VM-36]
MTSTPLLDSLRSANLFPSKVIPESFAPTFTLSVKFSSISPEHGSLVRVSDVDQQPIVSITSTSSNSNSLAQSFTFMLIDPDAPTPDDPKFAYWRHWVVMNIPSTTSSDITKAGRTLTPYLAPGPKDESQPHRYLFLLFSQPEGLKLERGDVGGEEFVDRRSFRAEEFVARYGLELLGVQWMRGVGNGWKEGKEEL